MAEAKIVLQQTKRKASIDAHKKKQKEQAKRDRPVADFFRRPITQQPLSTAGDERCSSVNNAINNSIISVGKDEGRTLVNVEDREEMKYTTINNTTMNNATTSPRSRIKVALKLSIVLDRD